MVKPLTVSFQSSSVQTSVKGNHLQTVREPINGSQFPKSLIFVYFSSAAKCEGNYLKYINWKLKKP